MGSYGGIPEADRKILEETYAESPERISDVLPSQFAHNINWRIYTEWCMNGYPGATREVDPDEDYAQVGPFGKWVTKETHYALERAGFRWDADANQFVPGEAVLTIYDQTRRSVLAAVTQRAIEFFRECDEYRCPKAGDTRNLRGTLEPYMQEAQVQA